MLTPYLLLGEIVRPQGVRGEVKLRHYTDDPARFAELDTVFLKRGESYQPIRVLSARAQKDDVYLLLEGVRDRDAAEALRDTQVYVDRAHARALGEGEVFVADVLGAKAEDTHGAPLGVLTDVLQNGPVPVLVFASPKGTLMLPWLKRAVVVMDAENGRIVLDENVLDEVAVYEDRDPDALS